MWFPTWNTLKPLRAWSLNHHHRLCLTLTHTPVPVLHWKVILLSHGNETLRVALRPTSRTILTTRQRPVKSTNISTVGSWTRVLRRTMTTCWRKNSALCISQASKPGMTSRSSWPACQIIRLLGSRIYTGSRIWDGMTFTDALLIAGVETFSKAWDGGSGSQPMLSILFTPLSIAITLIHRRYASLPKGTLQTGGGRHQ